MILKEPFLEAIKKLADLSGQRVMTSVAELLWEELKHTEIDDFEKAMEKMKFEDKRITLGNISRAINEVKSARKEIDTVKNRKVHSENANKFWKENKQHIDQGRCNRKCIGCPVKFCDIIHEQSIKVMHEMIDGHKTLSQVNAEMAVEFEGWERGFKPPPF